jgi:hypothetical protein
MNFQLASMTGDQATETLKQQGAQNVEPIRFTQVNDYTTFRAEFAVEDGDLIFHFFLPPEVIETAKKLAEFPARLKDFEDKVRKYWLDSFARTLDVVARSYFQAGPERLAAQYIDDYELKSWWLRCSGFGHGLAPEDRANAFLEKLDQALDALKVNTLLV